MQTAYYLCSFKINASVNSEKKNNDNIKLTSAEDDAEVLARHIAYTEERGLALIPPETGDYDSLAIDLVEVKGYDEVMVYSETREFPADIYDLQNTK